MNLDWPESREEALAPAALFVEAGAEGLRRELWPPSQLDLGRGELVVPRPRPHESLSVFLRVFIPTVLHIGVEEDAVNHSTWEDLCDKILASERQYEESTQGFWHRLWYKTGDSTQALDGWVALIPEAYGLAVVKTGLAVVFKLAEKSALKRQKILDTFLELRDALARADPKHTSFRYYKEVGETADQLYETIVDSLEDMIRLTTKGNSVWHRIVQRSKKEERPPLRSPDDILKEIVDRTKAFERAVSVARDKTIEGTAFGVQRTAALSQYTAATTALMHRDLVAMGEHTATELAASHETIAFDIRDNNSQVLQVNTTVNGVASELAYVKKRVDETAENEKRLLMLGEIMAESRSERNAIALRELERQQEILDLKNHIMHMLQDRQQDKAILEKILQGRKHGALINLDRLCELIACKPGTEDGQPDMESVLGHSNEDLSRALDQRGRFDSASQGQAHSILRHQSFVEWLDISRPGIVLVDANLRNAGLQTLSAISLFSATFLSSLIEARPDDVVLYYFCGCHVAARDEWYGPIGLVRSLILQILTELETRRSCDLSFIDNRDLLEALQDHDLDALCDTFYSLISQVPADTTIFIVIDSISNFDKDRLFPELECVMGMMQDMVNDRTLIPCLKVLVTNATRSTRRVRQLDVFKEDPDRLITLSSANLMPVEISKFSMDGFLEG